MLSLVLDLFVISIFIYFIDGEFISPFFMHTAPIIQRVVSETHSKNEKTLVAKL